GNNQLNLSLKGAWNRWIFSLWDGKNVNRRGNIQSPSLGRPNIGRRDHLAGVRAGDEMRFYFNGKLAGSAVVANLRMGAADGPMIIGGNGLKGIVDEIRFSKVARYHQDFTPAPRFAPDDDTLALYHFHEGAGSVVHDASRNNRHGRIVGAKWVRA